ncbi:MAG: sensor histidine kinase, partial [Candidatus Sumerlaeaceae bacterium]
LLDLARIEAGRMEFNLESFEAASLLSEVSEMMRPLADQQDTRIEVITAGSPCRIHADRQKLRQVLINLVANAVKFTSKGVVRLQCKGYTEAEQEWLRFEVSDTGPGLSPGQIARLFGEYEQGEPPGGDQVEGTGLGLAISRQLCLAMGGSLTAENKPDGGALFTIQLPATQSAEQTASHPGTTSV